MKPLRLILNRLDRFSILRAVFYFLVIYYGKKNIELEWSLDDLRSQIFPKELNVYTSMPALLLNTKYCADYNPRVYFRFFSNDRYENYTEGTFFDEEEHLFGVVKINTDIISFSSEFDKDEWLYYSNKFTIDKNMKIEEFIVTFDEKNDRFSPSYCN